MWVAVRAIGEKKSRLVTASEHGDWGIDLAWVLVDLFAKDTDGLYLRFDQSYGAACVLASIDE